MDDQHQNDSSGLGKGLESLIPKKSDAPASPHNAPAPVASQSQPVHLDPSHEINGPHQPVFLVSLPHEELLSAGDPPKEAPHTPAAAQPAPVQSFAPVVKPAAAPSRATSPHRSSDLSSQKYEAIFHIETFKIKPNPQQPRRDFNEEAIKELASSIREFGILQPLVVTKHETEVATGTEIEYYLIAGERRLLAAKYLGLPTVPAIVKNVNLERERLEMAIIENLQRENLNPIEMARAFARLGDEFRLTQREIAMRLGKSREVVANTMRLLDLPQDIQDAVAAGTISESHGRLLLAVTDPVSQKSLFNDLIHQHLTTRDLRNRVESIKSKLHPAGLAGGAGDDAHAVSPELKMLQEKLSHELGAPVKISAAGEGGKITISFYSKEELDNILNKLKTDEEGM